MEACEPLDQIRISRWSVWVGIGAYDHEKFGTQQLVLDLVIRGDFRQAADTDRLEDALDYAAVKEGLEAWVRGRRWQLLEAFAEEFCARVLDHGAVEAVTLTVDKPAAQAPALVSYTITRKK